LQDDFKKITCHVLFVYGDKDTWVPIENIDYGKKMMIHAKSIAADTLFAAGHNIPWERTAEFKKILLGLK
jgi:pimeloyl-ACP methyl ester carboxylesterase